MARDDQDAEPVETVAYAISTQNTGPNLTIDPTPVSVDIIDNDISADVSVSVDRMTVDEAGTQTATFTATLSQPVNNQTTICFLISGTASGQDYTITGLTESFRCLYLDAGLTQGSFTVVGREDFDIENPNETVTFALNGSITGPNMTITGSPATITIIDNDGRST